MEMKLRYLLPLLPGDGRMLVQAVLEGAQNVQGVDAVGIAADQRAGDPVDHIAGVDAPSSLRPGNSFCSSSTSASLNPFHLLPVVQAHFFHQVHALLLGFLQPGQDGENGRRPQGVGGDVHMFQIALADQLVGKFVPPRDTFRL